MNVRAEALEMEQSLYTRRLEVAKRYARDNKLNNVVFENPRRLAGHHHRRQDLQRPAPGLPRDWASTTQALRRYGIRILKMGMLFPMEPTIVREFAQGLEEIFVIEEKRPFLEMFAKNVLYGMANAPRIVGKFDEEEKELLPHYGEFESDVIGRALTKRLSRKTRVESAEAWLKRLDEIHARDKLPTATRTAWYCSGCPHNSSTVAPEGSIVSAGIGCHTMAMWMDRNVVMGTHMGAEGAQWIGMAPFTDTKHIFQNMGDGTYAHSGSLAIRYCASHQHQHHLQAAAQRPHLDDRRPGHPGRGAAVRTWCPTCWPTASRRSSSPATTREADQRRACPVAPKSGTATASTRRSACWPPHPAPPCCSTTRNAPPNCAARAAAARPRNRPKSPSSTSASAKAAATAARSPTA